MFQICYVFIILSLTPLIECQERDDCELDEYIESDSCDSFLRCVQGRLVKKYIRFSCPPGTVFHAPSGICNHGSRKRCDSDENDTSSELELPSLPTPLPPGPDFATTRVPQEIVTDVFVLPPGIPPENVQTSSPVVDDGGECAQYEIDKTGDYDKCTSVGVVPSFLDCSTFYRCIRTMGCILKGFYVRCPNDYIFDEDRAQCLPATLTGPCTLAQDTTTNISTSQPTIQLTSDNVRDFFETKAYWKFMAFISPSGKNPSSDNRDQSPDEQISTSFDEIMSNPTIHRVGANIHQTIPNVGHGNLENHESNLRRHTLISIPAVTADIFPNGIRNINNARSIVFNKTDFNENGVGAEIQQNNDSQTHIRNDLNKSLFEHLQLPSNRFNNGVNNDRPHLISNKRTSLPIQQHNDHLSKASEGYNSFKDNQISVNNIINRSNQFNPVSNIKNINQNEMVIDNKLMVIDSQQNIIGRNGRKTISSDNSSVNNKLSSYGVINAEVGSDLRDGQIKGNQNGRTTESGRAFSTSQNEDTKAIEIKRLVGPNPERIEASDNGATISKNIEFTPRENNYSMGNRNINLRGQNSISILQNSSSSNGDSRKNTVNIPDNNHFSVREYNRRKHIRFPTVINSEDAISQLQRMETRDRPIDNLFDIRDPNVRDKETDSTEHISASGEFVRDENSELLLNRKINSNKDAEMAEDSENRDTLITVGVSGGNPFFPPMPIDFSKSSRQVVQVAG